MSLYDPTTNAPDSRAAYRASEAQAAVRDKRETIDEYLRDYVASAFATGGKERSQWMDRAHAYCLENGLDSAGQAAWRVNDLAYAMTLLADDAKHDEVVWTRTANPAAYCLHAALTAALDTYVEDGE